jgi:PAS domain S-box-containing protein
MTPTNADQKTRAGRLRVLVVEDQENDLLLLLHELDRAGYEVTHRCVDTLAGLRRALAADEGWDIVVSDFSLPTMTAHEVLDIVKTEGPDLPCIVVSGTIAEEAAVDLLKAGARDFVVKQRMARLVPAIRRELQEASERRRLLAAEKTLHEMRERMQFAMESVGVGFWEWDMRSGRVVCSDVLERLHGLEPGRLDGTFEAFIATVHPEDRDWLIARTRKEQPASGDSRFEYRCVWPDGTIRWILTISRTLCSDDGAPSRATGVSMDITAQKQLETQFRQAQKMESIGNLAGGIAHDFNNLLTVVTGCCEMAADRVGRDPEVAELLESIRTAAVSASALTHQLLTFSRREVVRPRLLILNDTIQGFRNILRRLIEENIKIEFKLAPAAHQVNIDPGQIEQVLLNLVANARDAMPQGGAVSIATDTVTYGPDDSRRPPEAPPGTYAVLSVRDTGSGMSPEVQSRLFEPFFTTKPVGHGTGLGLATVYGIVKQNGGHISVHSTPGAGTTFSIHLPVAEASAEMQLSGQEKKAIDLSGNETVLIVEDNAPLRHLATKILQRYGYQVLAAANGEQAQRICTQHPGPIHVIVMDVIMPGDSGPIVAERIRLERPDSKIIFTSGYIGHQPDYRHLFRSGSDFLPKPFDSIQLARAVRDALTESPSH